MIKAKYSHKITFLQNNANSEIEETNYERLFDSYASIKAISDSSFSALENMNFGAVIAEEFYLFELRYIKGINVNLRIKHADNIYKIKRIINKEEKNRYLTIVALRIN